MGISQFFHLPWPFAIAQSSYLLSRQHGFSLLACPTEHPSVHPTLVPTLPLSFQKILNTVAQMPALVGDNSDQEEDGSGDACHLQWFYPVHLSSPLSLYWFRFKGSTSRFFSSTSGRMFALYCLSDGLTLVPDGGYQNPLLSYTFSCYFCGLFTFTHLTFHDVSQLLFIMTTLLSLRFGHATLSKTPTQKYIAKELHRVMGYQKIPELQAYFYRLAVTVNCLKLANTLLPLDCL
jgi:hypothetical protein